MYNFYSFTSHTTGITEVWPLPLEQELKLVLNFFSSDNSTEQLSVFRYQVLLNNGTLRRSYVNIY